MIISFVFHSYKEILFVLIYSIGVNNLCELLFLLVVDIFSSHNTCHKPASSS